MPPVVDRTKCIRCGKCVDTCTEDVFFDSRKKQFPEVTYPEECVYCHACVEECPVEGAIRLRIPLPMMLLYRPDEEAIRALVNQTEPPPRRGSRRSAPARTAVKRASRS